MGSRVSRTDHRPSVCATCAFQFVLDSRSFGIDVSPCARFFPGQSQRPHSVVSLFSASWFYDLGRVWRASRFRSLKRLGISGIEFAGQQRRNWKFWVESPRRAPPKLSRPLATEHQWGRHRPPRCLFAGDNMIPLSEFPAIDATLNAASALLLTLGYFLIRRKRIQAHKVCMLSAFATSSLFLDRYPVPRSPRCHALRQARRRARSLPGTARFAHNSRGGHRAVDIDDATPGLARTVRASQENRSLDTPS